MDILQIINDAVSQLLKLTPEVLLGAFIVGFGYVLRGIKWINNSAIPFVCCVAGAVIYPFIAKPGQADPVLAHPFVRLAMIGFLIGFLSWIFHDKLLSRFEDRIPGLKDWLARGSEGTPNNQPPTTKP
jgi:hypothetical protein